MSSTVRAEHAFYRETIPGNYYSIVKPEGFNRIKRDSNTSL